MANEVKDKVVKKKPERFIWSIDQREDKLMRCIKKEQDGMFYEKLRDVTFNKFKGNFDIQK